MAHKNVSCKSISKNGFVDRGWMLNIQNDEDEAILYISIHAWNARGVWCGKMEKMKAVIHIVHHVAEASEAGICEVQYEYGKCFYLRTSNIANEVEKPSRKMKTTNLVKPHKWWDEMDKQMQLLQASLMAFANSLTTEEDQMLERFMIEWARKEANGEVPTKDSLDQSSPIQKVILFFSQCAQLSEVVEEHASSSKGKKQGRQPPSTEGQEIAIHQKHSFDRKRYNSTFSRYSTI